MKRYILKLRIFVTPKASLKGLEQEIKKYVKFFPLLRNFNDYEKANYMHEKIQKIKYINWQIKKKYTGVTVHSISLVGCWDWIKSWFVGTNEGI